MNAKMFFALLTVFTLVFVPVATMIGESNGSDADDASEIKEGTHVKFDNLNGEQFTKLFVREKSNEGGLFTDYLFLLAAATMPGLNPVMFRYGGIDTSAITMSGVSFEIDYAHTVNEEKTDVGLKFAMQMEVEEFSFKVDLTSPELLEAIESAKGDDLDIDSIITTQDVKTYLEWEEWLPYTLVMENLDLFSNGQYARSLMEKYVKDGKPMTITGQKELTISGKLSAKFFLDGDMDIAPIEWRSSEEKYPAFIFTNGGYLFNLDLTVGETNEKIPRTIPVSTLKLDLSSALNAKFGDNEPDSFDAELKLDFAIDIERTYGCELSKAVPADYEKLGKNEGEKGTLWFDEVKSSKFVITESNKFNGDSNNKLVDADKSDTIKALIDGRVGNLLIYDVFEDIPRESTGKKLNIPLDINLVGNTKMPTYQFIHGYKANYDMSIEDNEKETLTFIKDKVGISEENYEINREYDDANKGADSIRDGIDGKTGSNDMMVVGIVIAVIVILALVALWYFKFRPQEESAQPVQQSEPPKTENP